VKPAVHYELSFRSSKAALQRVAIALIEGMVHVRRYVYRGREYDILVSCTPGAAATLREAANAFRCVYKSPMRLFGSTLVAQFDSADDELAGRESERYRKLSEAAVDKMLAEEARRRQANPHASWCVTYQDPGEACDCEARGG